MSSSKRIPFPVLAAIALSACSGALPKETGGGGAKGAPAFEKISVPATIAAAKRDEHERILFLLPQEHPGRIPLRDRLAESYARSFAAAPEEDHRGRLKLFEAALALHEPADFAPEKVADAAVPMAEWVTDRYEVLGDEGVVLAGLRYLMLARPNDGAVAERYLELAEWSESVRKTVDDDMDRLTSIGGLYMQVVKRVPDREVVDRLAAVLIQRHEALMGYLEAMERQGGGMPPFLLRALLQEGGVGKDIVHIYFLAGDPAAALAKLRGLGSEGGAGREHLELLERLESGEDPGEAWFAVAGLLGDDDPRLALRACAAARALDRRDPRFPMCLGRAFERLGRPWNAVEQYVEAARTSPEEEVVAQSMELIREALLEIHRLERADTAADAIAQADALVERALASEDGAGETIPMSAAALMFTCGVVEFDDGAIDSAEDHFRRALTAWPGLLWAAEKSVEIDQLRGRHAAAIEAVTGILARTGDDAPDPFWQAKLLEQRADSYMATLEVGAATADYREALVQWGMARIPDDAEPEAAFRMGVIHDRLGELDLSRESFRKAIRLDPDRRATYADLLSFLVTRGRLEDAVEFYRLAFNQDRIESMWKIYYSMWVDGLSARTGAGPCDLATGYLRQSDGRTWQDDLARHYSGRLTSTDLRKKAANKGQQVEADFYSALRLMADGKTGEAKALLEKVVRSDFMGFFEYRMAREMLSEAR